MAETDPTRLLPSVSTAIDTVASHPSDPTFIDDAPIPRQAGGKFGKGNKAAKRRKPNSLVQRIKQTVGQDGHKLVAELWRYANPKTRENGKPIPHSIRLEAMKVLLERGWHKVGPAQPEVSHQPIFNLPPGSHVAIAITTPRAQEKDNP